MLTNLDSDRVYIIQAAVDKLGATSSLAKAKKEGIEMAKLPLDKFAKWQRGNKQMTINGQLKMLLDANFHGDWRRAIIDNVPLRKIKPLAPGEIESDRFGAKIHKQRLEHDKQLLNLFV